MTSGTIAQTGTFLRNVALLLTVIFPACGVFAESTPACVAVFDFTPQSKDGSALADAIRMKLSRVADTWNVIDSQTMRGFDTTTPSMKISAAILENLLRERVGANVCVFGNLTQQGEKYIADVRIFDTRSKTPEIKKYLFEDNTQRWRGVIAKKIVETLTCKTIAPPSQYGDEPVPSADELEGPLNVNSSFESVDGEGWEAPDNVACSIVTRPADGRILQVCTAIDRDEYLAYRKALLAGEASVNTPPQVKSASSVNSIATQEGVHFKSDFLPADVNATYWLSASYRFLPAKGFAELASPIIFIKGFKATPAAFDGLPESSLKQLKMSPADFAALSPEKRRELITADARKNPKKYLRECYRWQMNCAAGKKWTTQQAKFPPHGKLPADVQFLQIQIYSYSPPGQYFWDNVSLYKQKTAPEKRK